MSKWLFTRRVSKGERMPLLRMLSANSSNRSSSNVLRGLVKDSTNSARGTFTYSCNCLTASLVLISFSPCFLNKMFSAFLTETASSRRGTGSLVATRCGSSRFHNGSGGGKDVRRVVVGDFSFGFQPVLDVAPAELCAVESERFATDQRDGFRFHLAQMAGSVFTVHELFGSRVPENNVRNFVECGFVRERG